jgi:hypothetical protein
MSAFLASVSRETLFSPAYINFFSSWQCNCANKLVLVDIRFRPWKPVLRIRDVLSRIRIHKFFIPDPTVPIHKKRDEK